MAPKLLAPYQSLAQTAGIPSPWTRFNLSLGDLITQGTPVFCPRECRNSQPALSQAENITLFPPGREHRKELLPPSWEQKENDASWAAMRCTQCFPACGSHGGAPGHRLLKNKKKRNVGYQHSGLGIRLGPYGPWGSPPKPAAFYYIWVPGWVFKK